MKAVKDLGITLTKNARLILGADEETACRDTEYYYSKFAEAPCSFSPDAEYPLINIEKGGLYTKYSAQWKEETADVYKRQDFHRQCVNQPYGRQY